MKHKPFNLKHALIIFTSAVVFALAWGFLIGGETVDYMCFGAFCLTAVLTCILRGKEGHWGWFSVLVTVLTAYFLSACSMVVYQTVNTIHGTQIMEYDAPVTEVYSTKDRTYIDFEDTNGNTQRVGVYPWHEGRYDEEYLYDLETIHIKEYDGLFHITYYKWYIE